MFTNPLFIWALLGLVLVLAEFFVPGLVVIFFGAGALVTAIISAILPGVRGSMVLQIVIWLATSGLCLGLLRKYLSKVFRGRMITEAGEDDVVGKAAEVVEVITPDKPGRVRFEGTTWAAESYTETFNPGDRVEILKQENITLIVTRPMLDLDNGDRRSENGDVDE